MFSKKFVVDAAERAISTFAQAYVASAAACGAGAVFERSMSEAYGTRVSH